MIQKLIISLTLIVLVQLVNAQTPEQLPEGTKKKYTTYRDARVSDEFNTGTLDTDKWKRRFWGSKPITDHIGDASLVQMESVMEGDHETKYVSIKGRGGDKGIDNLKTAGLIGTASGFYGFYVVRFQYKGFDNQKTKTKGNIWHPAVWTNRAAYGGRVCANSDWWLEIDLMEWEGTHWSSDAPAYITDSEGVERKVVNKGEGIEKAMMLSHYEQFDDGWQTIGMEYTPDRMKLWEWKNGEWVHIGEREVQIVDDDPEVPESKFTPATIGRKAASPGFWHIGNTVAQWLIDMNVAGTRDSDMSDMEVNYDFFRYYRHVDYVDVDWRWENNLPNGGPGMVKDDSPITPIYQEPTSEIIIDNGDVGYTESGTWNPSSLTGYNNSSTRWSSVAGSTATWTPSLSGGSYEVFIYKVQYPGSDPSAKITIKHNGGTSTQTLNYAVGTSGWVSLGTFNFAAGTSGYVRNTHSGGGNARADAVRFTRVEGDSTSTSIEKKPLGLHKIKLYPNPATNSITISGLADAQYLFQVINTNGKIVHKQRLSVSNQEALIDTSGLTKGVYFLNVKSNTVNQQIMFSKI